MPKPRTSVTLTPVGTFEELAVGDLIVFQGRLYRIFNIPKTYNPESPSLQMEVLHGHPDDTQQGWRYLSTLVQAGALKLVIT
jgi:hypothetical protein